MSDLLHTTQRPEKPNAQPNAKQRRPMRIVGIVVLSVAAFVLIVLSGAALYSTTDDFQRRVGGAAVNALEDATGGRVELGHISLNVWRLAIEVDGLTIHGTEPAGEMPYLSAAKILVNVKINTFLTHIRGLGAQSHIGLNLLRVEQPRVHLIVDKDGKTNQPVPKHPSRGNEPIQHTLLDLQAGKVELVDGLAVLNQRAIPFDLAAKNLQAEAHYIAPGDRYGMSVDLGDLQTKMAAQPEVHSRLQVAAELGRDSAKLTRFDFQSGAATHLLASGNIEHFANPEWQTSVKGGIDLKQLSYLADVAGLNAGRVDLELHGHNCLVTPQAAQTAPRRGPRFWQRHKTPASSHVLPPDPDCKSGYLLLGAMKVHDAGYRDANVRFHDINGSGQLHVTPDELLFTSLVGTLPGGGEADGVLKIENWLGEVPADTAKKSPRAATARAATKTANTTAVSVGAKAPVHPSAPAKIPSAHATITATVKDIPLRTIMDTTAPENAGDLGFDTAITGPVTVEWGGSVADVNETVQVQADLKLAPTGVARKGALSNIPVSGTVLAHYDGEHQVVNIQQVQFQSPATTLNALGVLGVNQGDPLTNLQVTLQARDLGEFDQLLQTLDFNANGKKGTAAIPVVLHGTLGFVGSAKGQVRDLDVKGQLTADNLALHFGTMADVHIDSVVADAEYSPYAGVAVASSTVRRGTALLNLSGAFRPHKVVKRQAVEYDWDAETAIDATVKLASAQAADLLQIAGQQDKVPLTGTVSMDAHAAGTVHDLNGAGHVTLSNGVAYGESYQTVALQVTAQGQQINATQVQLTAHGMSVNGSGSYNLQSKRIAAQLGGNGLRLSKFDTFQKAAPNADGTLTFRASMNGTPEEPGLNAQVNLADAVVQGKTIGSLTATATSSGSDVRYELHSMLVGAQVEASGQTSLLGDYPTQAKLTLSGLDIAHAIALFAPGSVNASSKIAGTVTVSGPLKTPQKLAGTAEFQDLDVKLETVELRSAEPLRASLRDGTVTLDQVHITGPDTDLRAAGTAKVLGDDNAQGGAVHLTAEGSVNVALAHSFDKEVLSSGKISFKMAAEGRMNKPQLSGNVQVQNVNLAFDGVANGLSNMNGTLAFNEDRLDVKNLTATTGGGQLKIGGYLAYQKGLFADLSATGDVVRVRLDGLSSTATANLRLQGGPESLQLSGNVLVTRFGVGPDVDFSSFAGSSMTAPPAPDSLTNRIHMDVRVTSAPQLDFQNSFAKLAGTVDLTVRGTVAQPTVLGRIQITEGSAVFAGTKYELQRGTVTFSNPLRIDPVIDLDASARVENYDITIGVHGTVEALHPTYRSQPPLTDADIFNLLALGRTQAEAQSYQQQQQQAGADPTTDALLGGALNATVSSRVNKLFGAGSVKIDPTYVGSLGQSSARITVQEPVSKQVTLVFATNVNQTAQQLIQVQYRINQNTSVVVTRDENGVFSVVYRIRQQYR